MEDLYPILLLAAYVMLLVVVIMNINRDRDNW